MSHWKGWAGGGWRAGFTLSCSVSRLTLSLCYWQGNPFGSHSTGGGIYQNVLATRQMLAVSVKELHTTSYHTQLITVLLCKSLQRKMYILLRSGCCYESNNIAASALASCDVLNPAPPLRVICFIGDQLSQSAVCLNSLKPEVHLNNILIFSSDLAEITLSPLPIPVC